MEIQKILGKSDEMFQQNQIKEAVEYLKSNLEQAQKEGDWKSRLTLLNELMGYYRSISDLEQAWEYAVTAVEIITEYGIDETIAGVTTFLNIANIYRAQGDVKEAMDLYLRVEQIYKAEGLKKDYRLGGLYNNMSVAALESGDRENAVKYGEAAIEVLAEVPGTSDERATVYGNLAGVLLKGSVPDFERIEMYLNRSLGIFERECQNSPHYCGVLAMKAYVLFLKKDLQESLNVYEKALEETKKHYGENADYQRLKGNYEEVKRRLDHGTK